MYAEIFCENKNCLSEKQRCGVEIVCPDGSRMPILRNASYIDAVNLWLETNVPVEKLFEESEAAK